MLGDKKKGNITVIEKKRMDEGVLADASALISVAEELISSVKTGDVNGVAAALKAAFYLLEGEEDLTEGEY